MRCPIEDDPERALRAGLDMPRRTLLVALAHPDDESFGVGGVMARAVAEGHRVVIVCATRGEVGEISDPSLATAETLGQVREGELRAAAAALGVEDVRFLGYRDSGMVGSHENGHPDALANARAEEIVPRVVAIVREVRPDVVVTFEPGGIYGHPDHVAISRHVTAAFGLAADPSAWPERGRPHAPARLYHLALPRRLAREFAEDARRKGEDLPWELADMGVEDDEISAAVDVRPWLPRKLAALEAHATQRRDIERMPPEMRERFFATEWFVLVRGADATEAKGDLLAGLP